MADFDFDGSIGFRAGVRLADLEKDLAKLRREVRGTVDKVEDEGKRMEQSFRGAGTAIAAIFTAQQATQLIKGIADVRAEFQKYEAVLTNTLGSSKEAADSMNLIKNIASTTPFGVGELTESFVKLVNQGFKPTREQIISLGDLAASQGKSFNQLTEAIIDAQTGEFERLKELGIRTSKEGDKVAFTFKGITKEVQFTGEAIREYITGLGNMQGVAGGMEAISKTIGGQISNLQDSIQNMFNEIGQSSEGAFSDAISAASFLVENYKEVGKILAVLITTYGAYKTAVILATLASNGWSLSQALGYRWLLLVEKAQKALNATMLANPYVAAATAITAVVTALVLFSDKTTQAEAAQERLNDAMADANEQVIEQKLKIQDLVREIQNENNTNGQRVTALNRLKEITNGRLNQLTIEAFKTGEATRAINDYIAALDREAKAKAQQDIKVENYKRLAQIEQDKKKGLGFFQSIKYGFQQALGGGLSPAVAYRNQELEDEAKALRDQNKQIDDNIRSENEALTKRSASQKEAEVKNKEYYEALKKDAQSRLDALADVEAKGAAGRKIIAEIQGYDKILSSYSVNAANKAQNAASKQALSDNKALLNEQKQLDEERERLIQQTNDKLEDLRIERLEGIEKDKAIIEREYNQMVEAFKRLGILDKGQPALDTFKSASLGVAEDKYNKQRADDNKQWLDQSIKDYGSYAVKRVEIEKYYTGEINKAVLNGRQDLIAGIEAAQREALARVDADNIDAITRTKDIFNDVLLITTESVKQQIESIEYLLKNASLTPEQQSVLTDKLSFTKGLLNLNIDDRELAQLNKEIENVKEELLQAEAAGIKSAEALKILRNRLEDLQADKTAKELDIFSKKLLFISSLAGAVGEIGSVLSNLGDTNPKLASLGLTLTNLADDIANLSNAWEKLSNSTLTSADKFQLAANFIINTISDIAKSVQQNRLTETQYLQDVIAYQHGYNLALLEEQRIKSDMKSSIFHIDSLAKIRGSLKQQIDLVNEYNEAMGELQQGSVKVGTKKARRDWAAIGGATAAGAGTGAIIGASGGVLSVPGAIIGGIVGFIGGFLKKRQVVDVYDNLLKVYPDLIDEEGRLNDARAKSLLTSNLLDAKTKETLQYVTELQQQYKEAEEAIKSVVEGLIGDVGNNIMDELVNNFKNGGENAGDAFRRGFAKSLENLYSDLIYSAILGPELKKLEERIKAGFAGGDDEAMQKALYEFLDTADVLGQQTTKLLQDAKDYASSKGIDIYSSDGSTPARNQNSLKGAISSASQESIDLLAGHTMGMRVAQLKTNELLTNGFATFNSIADRSLGQLVKIEANTYKSAQHLQSLDTKIKSADNASRAIGL
ncbi:tape measure protein [Niabella insulamsoli]|uniref:tape measure protein n=1 Tax=Niabella insulamsoli TaxID=3144874 RepID=UPI0031FC84BB